MFNMCLDGVRQGQGGRAWRRKEGREGILKMCLFLGNGWVVGGLGWKEREGEACHVCRMGCWKWKVREEKVCHVGKERVGRLDLEGMFRTYVSEGLIWVREG